MLPNVSEKVHQQSLNQGQQPRRTPISQLNTLATRVESHFPVYILSGSMHLALFSALQHRFNGWSGKPRPPPHKPPPPPPPHIHKHHYPGTLNWVGKVGEGTKPRFHTPYVKAGATFLLYKK